MTDETELTRAQRRLVQSLQQTAGDPMQQAVGAYLNSSLQSARIDALTEMFLNPPPHGIELKGALEDATVKALNAKADAIEAAVRRIEIAQPSRPRLVPTN